MNLNGMKVGFV